MQEASEMSCKECKTSTQELKQKFRSMQGRITDLEEENFRLKRRLDRLEILLFQHEADFAMFRMRVEEIEESEDDGEINQLD